MDELDILKDLCGKARKEPVPELDVADRVIRTLAAGKATPDRTLFFFTTGWAIAATVVAVLSWDAWLAFYDPFVLMLGSISLGF